MSSSAIAGFLPISLPSCSGLLYTPVLLGRGYNVLSAVKAALRAAHGAEKIEEVLSTYYLAEEIAGTYRGMMIAIPEGSWEVFATMTTARFAKALMELASKVVLEKLKKHPRGPKKPKPRRHRDRHVTHVATARILAKRKAASTK